MSRRVKITLPDPICLQLDRMALNAGQPVSRLAAEIVLDRLARRANELPSLRSSIPTNASEATRPAWLEPSRGSTRWRTWIWQAVVSLYNRYPRALADLSERWWENESCVETLGALAMWRERIDEAGCDPREELEFQTSLNDCSRVLQREIAGAMRPWTPGDPPRRWFGGEDRSQSAG
jgi:hypothetical protein